MESMQVHIPQIFQVEDPNRKVGEACLLYYGIKLKQWTAGREILAAFLEGSDEIHE